MQSDGDRIPILYLAPWVDIGGSDTATIDWFRFLDRDRFRPSLITTQPSPNRRLIEVAPHAEELWELPQLISGGEFPGFILSFIHTRGIRVVHIMNSRLAFDLLPDIASLPDPPRVVVQLHGEEPNQSGYVRYVTTRYGNLVDAFSVTGEMPSKALDPYDVPIGKRRTIPIGVDAEREFSPDCVRPIEGFDPTCFRILFPARLTAQKDPLLMVDMAAALRRAGLRFQIHVLGDGDLTEAVRERVVANGLEQEVLLHGPRVEVAPWYAACEAVLLTSEFETSPSRVAYEAMAMGLPIVAPDLPELHELIIPGTGVLVQPPKVAQAYASAICALAGDHTRRRAIGEAGRARVRSGFSLERMAAEHGSLYEEQLARPPAAGRARGCPPASRSTRTASAFRGRRPGAKPLVSVIVTCFNQGHYLDGCLQSIARQTYPSIETTIVDDGSTDAQTLAVLARIERNHEATVLQLPMNRGPAAARNAGIDHAGGRYVLPLDGDDLLVESAIADLVEQLDGAGDQIGFIYPNLQFFGNRNDYLEMPSYNLHGLLTSNQCAISSLIDREVFDRGLRYPEDITLGHEDWDFVLTLAEHGIYGEPARTKTLRCRKHAFTRSDLVAVAVPFGEVIAARHPNLFERRAELKGQWNPALTLIALDPAPEGNHLEPELVAAATRQTCPDFELIVRSGGALAPAELAGRLRRVPGEVAGTRAEALAQALPKARGRYALAICGSPVELLGDPALVEKMLRILRASPEVVALVLADSGGHRLSLGLLDRDAASAAVLGAICWRTTGPEAPPASLRLAGSHPLEALARWLTANATVQWRHLPRCDRALRAEARDGQQVELGAPIHSRSRDVHFREAPAELPECPPDVPPRLSPSRPWYPTQARLLCRHKHTHSRRFAYTNDMTSPSGHVLNHVFGCVRAFPLAGTTALRRGRDGRGFAVGGTADLDDPALLGFVEQTSLPLFDALFSGRHPESGERVLVAGQDDELAGVLQDLTIVGYIEPYPLRPRLPAPIAYSVVGLVRAVDLKVRRHRYGVGEVPPGLLAGELGALLAEPMGDCDPLWIDAEGRVFAATGALSNGRPGLRTALRWTADPLIWRGFSTAAPKLRASARRALDSARSFASGSLSNGHPSDPAGYLLRSPTGRTVPLFAAIHPVTGDQLLSTDSSEAASLGYHEVGLLGHLIARAPVTGALGPIRAAAPWASRFGLVALGL